MGCYKTALDGVRRLVGQGRRPGQWAGGARGIRRRERARTRATLTRLPLRLSQSARERRAARHILDSAFTLTVSFIVYSRCARELFRDKYAREELTCLELNTDGQGICAAELE